MTSSGPSPTTTRFWLIGLEAPQSVAQPVGRLIGTAEGFGMTGFPLPPMIPLLFRSSPPAPPVGGLLPGCRSAPLGLSGAVLSENRRWIIWPFEIGDWAMELAAALAGENRIMRDYPARAVSGTSGGETAEPVPTGIGIPLAAAEDPSRAEAGMASMNLLITDKPPGWRSLSLVCWSLEYLAGRPWYRSAAWSPLWRRRLKRAPGKVKDAG